MPVYFIHVLLKESINAILSANSFKDSTPAYNLAVTAFSVAYHDNRIGYWKLNFCLKKLRYARVTVYYRYARDRRFIRFSYLPAPRTLL